MTFTLLRNGTLIAHTKPSKPDASYGIKILRNHSLLLKDDRIVEMGEDIDPPSAATTIIECKDKIVIPGFVDTHHHVWQTQLKGRHADEMLLDYMYTGNLQSSNYTAGDIFWGQLSGCLEALDAGTTTVVDHAHCTQTPDHANAALHATVSSGIRSFFCYTPIFRVSKYNPLEMNQELLPDWNMKQLEELCKSQPIGDDRVRIGFACDFLFLPKDMLVSMFDKAKEWGAKLFTTHYVNPNSPIFRSSSPIALLMDYGILNPSVPTIFSHANSHPATDIPLLRSSHASISSTPDTELQMGLGSPVCLSGDPTVYDHSSLGIDCHSNNGASIATQMRLALQYERGSINEEQLQSGKNPARITRATVEKAFHLGTVLGARAVGMEEEIGSLEIGKKADVVIWDALSPGMVCAAEHDPVAAIVMHSSPRDIETVIVNGEVRKGQGTLKPARRVDPKISGLGGEKEVEVEWATVARELLRSREEVQGRIDKIDFGELREGYMKVLGVDAEKLVEGF